MAEAAGVNGERSDRLGRFNNGNGMYVRVHRLDAAGWYLLGQERMCADKALNLCHLGWYD